MSTSLPLPPTGRDFIVYQRIVVDHASTWTVAEELHISQTRVRQIVKRVMHWLAQSLPADSDLDDAAKIRLAQHIAADRLQSYLVEANQLWKETRHIRFLNLVLRIIAAQCKIPAFPGSLEALAADAIDGSLPDDPKPRPVVAVHDELQDLAGNATEVALSLTLDSAPGTLDSSPPPRDFSPESASDHRLWTSESALSCSPATPSANPTPEKSAARQAFLSPAHPLAASGQEPPVTELKITPQQLGFSPIPTRSVSEGRLSRRERRRLRRKTLAK